MQSVNDLFDWNDGSPTFKPTVSMPKLRNRLEYYDNGPKPAGKRTQYGLVLDRDNSTERWNFNFEVIDANDIVEMARKTPSLHEYNCLLAMLHHYTNKGLHNDANTYITVAKKNGQAGTGHHDLRYGQGAYDNTFGAILTVCPSQAPTVSIFEDGVRTDFLPWQWQGVQHSSHQSKLYQLKF